MMIRSPEPRRLAYCAIIAALTLLSACATTPDGRTVTIFDDANILFMDDDGLTQVEARQLDRSKRYAQMRMEGAAGGALLGALAGAVIVDGNRGAGAAGGAAIGAQIGYMAGAYVARLNSEAEDRRDDLNAQLAAAKNAVRETQGVVRDNREIVAAERRKIDRLNKSYRAGQITNEQYSNEISALEKKITIVDESIRIAESDVAAIEYTAASRENAGAGGAGALRSQKAQLEKQVRQLRQQRAALLQAVATIPPEAGRPSV